MSPVSSAISQAVRDQPIPLFERSALCEGGLHVGERTEGNGFHERRPPELTLVCPRVQKQANRVEPPEARQHAQAGFPVRADAGEINAVGREQRQQIE